MRGKWLSESLGEFRAAARRPLAARSLAAKSARSWLHFGLVLVNFSERFLNSKRRSVQNLRLLRQTSVCRIRDNPFRTRRAERRPHTLPGSPASTPPIHIPARKNSASKKRLSPSWWISSRRKSNARSSQAASLVTTAQCAAPADSSFLRVFQPANAVHTKS